MKLISNGLAELQAGNIDAAEMICRAVLASKPRDAEALNLHGMIAQHRGDFAAAVASYQDAISVRPDAAGFHNNLGVSLTAAGRVSEAAESYQRAANLNPKSPQIHLNLGNALRTMGRGAESVGSLRNAVSLHPSYAEARNSLAMSLYGVGDLEGSLAEFQKAVSLRPDFASAWSNLANVLRDVGRTDEAFAAYRRAISIQADHPDAHKNLAILRLLQGDYDSGFLEYEWRWKCDCAQLRRFDQPRWVGEDPSGKTVFVHEEQGYGDVIQFIRYAKVLADCGAKVIIGCRPELARLASCCDGVAQVVAAGQTLPKFDLHCPLLSLPLFCGTRSPAAVPAQVPYIKLSDPLTKPWKDRFAGAPALRVGLCWAGTPQNRNDPLRSILMEKLQPLSAIGDIEFHSLQVGPAAAERVRAPALKLHDHEKDLHDFADTAALIDQLDLVISVDTAVAHLAGALGKPTWILLPAAPDWRWLLNRTDSPWYPTARLFRAECDWDVVIGDVATQLMSWSQRPCGHTM
jgi:Flp pilus assembly protein TadD